MLTLHLDPIFALRGIEKPYNFLVKNGFTSHMASYIINGDPRTLKFDHMERLCEVLICEPNDLFAYMPNKGKEMPANHPLTKLRGNTKKNADLKKALSTLSYKELKEISSKFTIEIEAKK